MSVTVVSCVYGEHGRYAHSWARLVAGLDPAPDAVIVATDQPMFIPGARVLVSQCAWKHPQAFHLQQAILAARTEWVWILDIDDTPFPDALHGIDQAPEDVLVAGYVRADGSPYLPPTIIPDRYLESEHNPIPAGSFIRVETFRRVGGFPDVAFQDWGLWRRLAASGATFRASKRAHYLSAPGKRTAEELTTERRPAHIEEMLAHA